MKDFQGTMFIQEVPFTGMYWKGRITHQRQLVYGLKQGGGPMKMNIPSRGILGGMRNCMLIHIMKWILIMLSTTMIRDLIGLLGIVDVIVMIMLMMIMTIELVFLIKAGRIVGKEIIIMVGTVMIRIMSGPIGEMVAGEGVVLMNVNVTREI